MDESNVLVGTPLSSPALLSPKQGEKGASLEHSPFLLREGGRGLGTIGSPILQPAGEFSEQGGGQLPRWEDIPSPGQFAVFANFPGEGDRCPGGQWNEG